MWSMWDEYIRLLHQVKFIVISSDATFYQTTKLQKAFVTKNVFHGERHISLESVLHLEKSLRFDSIICFPHG